MTRACVLSFSLSSFCFAQTNLKVPPDLKFEVATLKPAAPNPNFAGIRPAPGGERYVAENATVKMMLTVAFRVRNDQIVGGPGWLDSDRFDMNAKAEKPSTGEELHAMLVNLLIERFNLKFHRDKKEMSMYALTVAGDGPKLTPHQASNAGEPWIDQAQSPFLHMILNGKFCDMDYLAFRLTSFVDRPIVDLTNLKGGYDFDLKFTRDLPNGFPENAQINGAPVDTSGPTLASALKQQLGLELKPQKGPVDVIVIDSASKLSGDN